jgi:MYXO-CTERM domain-containing protein
VIAGQCDYSDQFVMQEQKSDVPEALRDLIVLPFDDGKDATVIVIDRATTTSKDRKMYLDFHAPGAIGKDGTATVGASKLKIMPVGAPGEVSLVRPTEKDCFKGQKRGSCDASRFDATSYRAVFDGPRAEAIHVLSVTGGTTVTAAPLAGARGVVVTGGRDATVAWPNKPNRAFSYTTPKGTQIVLDEKDVTVTATPSGAGCKVDVAPGGEMTTRPAVFALDASCAVVADGAAASAASAAGTAPTRIAHAPRSGCCAAEAAPGTSFAMVGLVAFVVRRRRHRARS